MRTARVFISCGQKYNREKELGFKIEALFKERGFETFFAEEAHSPESLTEHIFDFIRESEYFVFVDFARESLAESEYRGSVFVNQEIAIATFLKIPGIGFVERGVRREGIINYQIYNPIPFIHPEEVLEKLAVLSNAWDIDSVNELNLTVGSVSRDYAFLNQPDKPLSDWWHVEVENRHRDKNAISCLAYLSSIKNLMTEHSIPVPQVELRWLGYKDFAVAIPAKTKREFDAFYYLHGNLHLFFSTRESTTTNPICQMPVLKKGLYRLEYRVVASNYEHASRVFLLDCRASFRELKFEPEPKRQDRTG
jgi:hypothetical protein